MVCCLWIYIIIIIVGALSLVRFLLSKLSIGDLQSKSVFITGCDHGFGHWLVLKLLRHGISVFAGCLTEKGEDELRKEAVSLPGHLETVSLDVTSQVSVDRAVAFVKEKLNEKDLWGLVNNAGTVGNFMCDDFLNVDDYQEVLNVNTLGTIRVTQAFKHLIKKSRGRIVTVSSVYGRLPSSGVGPYIVSKYGVEAYCDVIRQELVPFKVSVHIVEPGFFKTALTDEQTLVNIMEKVWNRASPEIRQEYGQDFCEKMKTGFVKLLLQFCSARTDYVVDAYFHALTSRLPRKRYWVGWDAVFFWIPISTLPTCLQDMVFKLIYRILQFPKPEMSP